MTTYTSELFKLSFACFGCSQLAEPVLNTAVPRNDLAVWVSKETLWADKLQGVSQFGKLKWFSVSYVGCFVPFNASAWQYAWASLTYIKMYLERVEVILCCLHVASPICAATSCLSGLLYFLQLHMQIMHRWWTVLQRHPFVKHRPAYGWCPSSWNMQCSPSTRAVSVFCPRILKKAKRNTCC